MSQSIHLLYRTRVCDTVFFKAHVDFAEDVQCLNVENPVCNYEERTLQEKTVVTTEQNRKRKCFNVTEILRGLKEEVKFETVQVQIVATEQNRKCFNVTKILFGLKEVHFGFTV